LNPANEYLIGVGQGGGKTPSCRSIPFLIKVWMVSTKPLFPDFFPESTCISQKFIHYRFRRDTPVLSNFSGTSEDDDDIEQ
jgi:hypothetical protein